MSVASHLNIRLDEYDARIRTFIPGYDDLLAAAANALASLRVERPHLVDLGTGTGALAARCLDVRPDARVTAVDADPDILAIARQRLAARAAHVTFVRGDFAEVMLPRCDAIVASLSLHHLKTTDAKRAVYRRCCGALSRDGLLVSADCAPPADAQLAALARDAWRAHLERTYSADETDGLFKAWAHEDVYFTLTEEFTMLRDAGFAPEVVWRAGTMVVIAARPADGATRTP